MGKAERIAITAAVIAGGLVGLGWVGLQVDLQPFPAHPDRGTPLETTALPEGLPRPVARFFHTAVGDQVPIVQSAVITGRGRLRLMGVTFPVRFRVTFDEATGLIRSLDALRYRAASDAERTPWRFEPQGWLSAGGMRIPSRGAITWLDEGSPWLVIEVEDVVYNADVTRYVRADGI